MSFSAEMSKGTGCPNTLKLLCGKLFFFVSVQTVKSSESEAIESGLVVSTGRLFPG